MHAANDKKLASQPCSKNVAKKAKRLREQGDDDLCEHMGANARVSSVCREKAKINESMASHLKSGPGRSTRPPAFAELFEDE